MSESPKDPALFAITHMGMAGRPWSRVHVDYAEPFIGKMFLLIIDAHSKLMGIHRVSSATSSVTIDRMRSTFPSHGLPDIAVFNSVSSEKKKWHQPHRS